jgi:hypothetical protein
MAQETSFVIKEGGEFDSIANPPGMGTTSSDATNAEQRTQVFQPKLLKERRPHDTASNN